MNRLFLKLPKKWLHKQTRLLGKKKPKQDRDSTKTQLFFWPFRSSAWSSRLLLALLLLCCLRFRLLQQEADFVLDVFGTVEIQRRRRSVKRTLVQFASHAAEHSQNASISRAMLTQGCIQFLYFLDSTFKLKTRACKSYRSYRPRGLLVVSPLQTCGRKCCEPLAHDGGWKRSSGDWEAMLPKFARALLSGNAQQAVGVPAPPAVTFIAWAARSGSQLTNHNAPWEEGKGSRRQAKRQRKLYQLIAGTQPAYWPSAIWLQIVAPQQKQWRGRVSSLSPLKHVHVLTYVTSVINPLLKRILLNCCTSTLAMKCTHWFLSIVTKTELSVKKEI